MTRASTGGRPSIKSSFIDSKDAKVRTAGRFCRGLPSNRLGSSSCRLETAPAKGALVVCQRPLSCSLNCNELICNELYVCMYVCMYCDELDEVRSARRLCRKLDRRFRMTKLAMDKEILLKSRDDLRLLIDLKKHLQQSALNAGSRTEHYFQNFQGSGFEHEQWKW